MLPSGGPRGVIVLAVLVVVDLGVWTAYYTVPSDSVAVMQCLGKYLKEVSPSRNRSTRSTRPSRSKEKLINEARRDYNKVIPLAEGEKDQRIREADGYRLKRISEMEGDAARFRALLAEYTKAPEVTRRRIYIETLQGIHSKIIVDEQTSGILPLLNLDASKREQP